MHLIHLLVGAAGMHIALAASGPRLSGAAPARGALLAQSATAEDSMPAERRRLQTTAWDQLGADVDGSSVPHL